MAWGEILDTDSRAREVTGSLLPEHCSSAGRTMGSEEPVHPTLLVTTTEIQLSLHQLSQLPGSRGTLAQAHSLDTNKGVHVPKTQGLCLGCGERLFPKGAAFPPYPAFRNKEELQSDLSCFKVLLPFPAEHSIRDLGVQRDK